MTVYSAETACRGTGRLLLNDAALDNLQALRDKLGKPLIVPTARLQNPVLPLTLLALDIVVVS